MPMWMNLLPAPGFAVDFGDVNKDGQVEVVLVARVNGSDTPARFVIALTPELAKNARDSFTAIVNGILAGGR